MTFDFNDDIIKPKNQHKVSKGNQQPPTAKDLVVDVEKIAQAKAAYKATQERDNKRFQTFHYFCLYGNSEEQIRAFSDQFKTQKKNAPSLIDETDDGEHLINVMSLAGLIQDLCREVAQYTKKGKEHPAVNFYDDLKAKVADSYIPIPKPFRQISGLVDDDIMDDVEMGDGYEF